MPETDNQRHSESAVPRHRVPLPRFISDEEIGAGDVIKRATATIGIRPCGGCAQRTERLNAWLGFSGRRPRS